MVERDGDIGGNDMNYRDQDDNMLHQKRLSAHKEKS
jgi:hypothetical protein